MPSNKRKRKHKKDKEEHVSRAVSDKNRLFHQYKSNHQEVHVNVDVRPPEDGCMANCFSGLANLFRRG